MQGVSQVEKETPLKLSNQSGRRYLVQKFGGTSIGKFALGIAKNVVKPSLDKHNLAFVCSARSVGSKETGTTNRLLNAAQVAIDSEASLQELVDAIQLDHIEEATLVIRDKVLLEKTKQHIDEECAHLINYLEAIRTIQEISPKSRDSIIGTGEKLACHLMAAVLQDNGVDATYVNFENIVPCDLNCNNGLDQKFYSRLSSLMKERLDKCGASVPVITGYFGSVPGSLLAAIGRGYSDLCGALIAVGLQAEELQIWKEVDGIFTADPRKVSNAILLPTITPEEAAELTYYGSEVIHPFTCEQVMSVGIPIRIKNVSNPQGSGTIIFPDAEIQQKNSVATSPSLTPGPTAVTTKNRIMVINVHSNRKTLSHGFFAGIFGTLDDRKLVVDLISTSEVHVSMAVHAGVRASDVHHAIEELKKYGEVDIRRNMTILSLVGKHMKNMVGIAGRMFSTLAACNVNIEMISQGASEINISCVINEADSNKAVTVLHQELLLHYLSNGVAALAA